MNNIATKERAYVIVTVVLPTYPPAAASWAAAGGAHWLNDAPKKVPDDRSALEAHFKNACALLSREIETLGDRSIPVSDSERQKLSDSLWSLLETHALLRNDSTRDDPNITE